MEIASTQILKTMQGEMLFGDKDTDTDKGLDDDENGELGAVEALTQLRPRNEIIVSPDLGNRVVQDSTCEGSLRSQIRRGVRSVRRASFGCRSGNGSSPHASGTSTKGSNKHTHEISSKEILDFYDEHHENVGQTRATPDFQPTKRSSRMCSRRKRKFPELGALKCPDASGKSDNSSPHVRSNFGLKLHKDMKGRWATERYESAQLKLIDIMQRREAAPGKPILRAALREEARKDIGDTGLLDHLLKHMTDTVIANGERFRRRHNAEGAMEYWLEDASLMEIRKAAKIEDPSWIPPPGWKPGDILPRRGDYGYGWFDQGMTPAEAAELKRLKETLDKLRSGLESLSSQVKRSRSRETRTPELKEGLHEDKHETTIETDQEGRSTCKILTEAKSQLEMDLSDVQKSVAIIQDYVHFTMMGLGLSQAEHTKLTEGNYSSAIESSSLITRQVSGWDATSAPVHPQRIDLDTTNCFATTSSPVNINHRMSSEEIERSKGRVQVDSSISCGNEANGLGLARSSSGVNWAIQNEVKTYNAPTRRYLEPGGIIPQRGAFSAWTEGVISPGTPPATSTAPYLGHTAATSRADTSALVLYDSTRTDNKDQFTPNFQHHGNFCLPSTESVVGRKPQDTVLPDHRPKHNRVKWMTGEGSPFQATCSQESEAHASVWVHRKPATAIPIQCVSREEFSNLTQTFNSFVGSTAEYSPSITVYPEATQCRLLHQGQTSYLTNRSGTRSGHSSSDSPQSSLLAVTAAQCDTSDSFKLRPFSVANRFSDKTLANPSKDSGSRAEHLVRKAISKIPPTAHMAKDTNLLLTPHRSLKPSYIASLSTYSTSVSGVIAEASSPCVLSSVLAAQADGSYGHIVPPYGSKSAYQVDCLNNIDRNGLELEQRQAPGKKQRLEGIRPTTKKSFHEIVVEKCSKANSSAWLALAPPNTSNLHSFP